MYCQVLGPVEEEAGTGQDQGARVPPRSRLQTTQLLAQVRHHLAHTHRQQQKSEDKPEKQGVHNSGCV